METRKSDPKRASQTRLIITAVAMAAGLLLGWAIDDLAFGLFIGFLVSLPLTARLSARQNWMEYPPGALPRIAGAGALFFAGMFLANWVMGREIDMSMKIMAGLLSALPGLLFVYTIGKAISQLDELQRRIQMEAMAIGFGLSTLTMIIVGLMADAGVPQLNWLFAGATMSAFWLIGKLWTMWKYQ